MEISIVYIDDEPDPYLTRYLAEEFDNKIFSNDKLNPPQEVRLFYKECKYNPSKSYRTIFEDCRIKNADVIIADHRLYADDGLNAHKFSGSQFFLLAKLLLRHAEVLIITQEKERAGELVLRKYESTDSGDYNDAKEFYNKKLREKVNSAIRRVIEERFICSEVSKNTEIEEVLKDRVNQMALKVESYSELSASDIDRLVQDFKVIKGMINDI